MHAYRFRVVVDENEDFVRDIEIQANQTFEDFHRAIMEFIKLPGNELASFYLCNGNWIKQKEITLIEMSDDGTSSDLYYEEEEKLQKVKLPSYLMDKAILKEFIDDPHQRMIYVYDYLTMNTFYIELQKIFTADPAAKYPECIRSVGDYKMAKATVPSADDLANILSEEGTEASNDLLPEGEEYSLSDEDTNYLDETSEFNDEFGEARG